MSNSSEHWERMSPERRQYILRNLVQYHLYQAQDWSLLFKVLDSQQYALAKLRYENSILPYMRDLDLGRKIAAKEKYIIEEGIGLLPYLWRYTLLRCSLASLADRHPIGAFQVLLHLEQDQEALGLSELLTRQITKYACCFA